VVGVAAVLLPAHGLSEPSAGKATSACREEYLSGLEAVFGRRRTHQQALTLRAQVTRRGFLNANVIEGCSDFRVVVRGIETFDIGVALQAEGRKEGFPVTLECIQAKKIGRLEAIFGHGRDRAAAEAIVNRAAAAGFPGLKLRGDPCGGFEVYLAGFDNQAEAVAFRDQARARGFTVVLEVN
jgi:hypothetical protein